MSVIGLFILRDLSCTFGTQQKVPGHDEAHECPRERQTGESGPGVSMPGANEPSALTRNPKNCASAYSNRVLCGPNIMLYFKPHFQEYFKAIAQLRERVGVPNPIINVVSMSTFVELVRVRMVRILSLSQCRYFSGRKAGSFGQG
jgi:hypothetical protein